jgi:hypothetical protein
MGEMNRKGFLTGYEHDIFVSYAHEDQLGAWTVALQEDLRKALNLILQSKLRGNSVDVWIDQILRNNLPLTDQLQGRVEGSALLMIVMSPFYLGSSWCGREVAWFAAATRSRIAPDRRIFVVHALPTDRTSWPPALAELTPYCFFARHLKANVELPLGLIGDDEDKTAYKAVLYNLAGQIRRRIEELLAEAETSAPSPPLPALSSRTVPRQPDLVSAPERLVFLEIAGASADAVKVKNGVRGVLEARNVRIFSPDDFGPELRDPFLAERHIQKVLKAKATCDGLVLLRLNGGVPIGDWLLDYISEVRPMAHRVRADRVVPPALLIEAALPASGPIAEALPSLRFDAHDFAGRLTAWVDRLPAAKEAAA